jgi:hypothetical protein
MMNPICKQSLDASFSQVKQCHSNNSHQAGSHQVFKSLLPHRFLEPPLVGDSWNVDDELSNFVPWRVAVASAILMNHDAKFMQHEM